MRVLLIANHSSVFGRELFEKLQKEGVEVTLLDFETLELFGQCHTDFYLNKFARYKSLPKLHMFFRLYFIPKILNENSFDVVNIHTARLEYVTIINSLSKSKLITTIYGSDFYRKGKLARRIQKFIYEKSTYITFTNPLTMDSFVDYYGEFEKKSVVCRFGLGTLDFIDKNRDIPKETLKTSLGYSTTKTIITCGYNATSAQQHEAIIDNIVKLDEITKSKIQLIFPMTYGNSEHKMKIKNILSSANLDYIILEDYMHGDSNANIKLASDIMINMLTSDSFSGSMQEFLYAKNIVITGAWLPYDVFDSNGVIYHKIENISNLKKKLEEVLMGKNTTNLDKNIDIISKLSSWNNNIQSWIDAYKN